MVGYIRALRTTLTICGLLFITVSVIYTTNFIFFSPLSSLISAIFDWLALLPAPQPARDLSPATHAAFLASRSSGEKRWTEPSGPMVSWISSRFTLQHGLGHHEAIPVNPGPLLSKGTAGSMVSSNVIPYFYRAKGSFDADDITITTLITSNRFKVFARLVEKYRGLPPASTIYFTLLIAHRADIRHRSYQGYR
jgi:glycosyltransferase-like protein LARGE